MEINALTAIVGGLGTLIGIMLNLNRYSKDRDKEVRSSASEQAVINTKLDGISNGVDSVRVDLKMLEKDYSKMNEQVVRNQEAITIAHKRIDKLEDRVNEN